jgi:hypothetical protein
MNVKIGAEAAQFPEKEYINGIAFAVYLLIYMLANCGNLNSLMQILALRQAKTRQLITI